MTSEPIACTIDPAQAPVQEEGFRALLATTRSVERPSLQHLRLTLTAERGLDIEPLAREKQCCRFFDFTLTPTTEGVVVLDVRVPADAGPVGGPAAEQRGVGSAEEILDWWAAVAAESVTREA